MTKLEGLSPAVQAVMVDAMDTAASIMDQLPGPEQEGARITSGIVTGLELGLALALARPETARHLLLAIDAEIVKGTPEAVLEERRAYLARYTEAIL